MKAAVVNLKIDLAGTVGYELLCAVAPRVPVRETETG